MTRDFFARGIDSSTSKVNWTHELPEKVAMGLLCNLVYCSFPWFFPDLTILNEVQISYIGLIYWVRGVLLANATPFKTFQPFKRLSGQISGQDTIFSSSKGTVSKEEWYKGTISPAEELQFCGLVSVLLTGRYGVPHANSLLSFGSRDWPIFVVPIGDRFQDAVIQTDLFSSFQGGT